MKEVFISFIIPCFNVSKYIRDCLDSIISNVINETYEIICVNDCSTDKTREVILEYASEYNQIRLIDHKINLKQGGAMNTGIENSIGKFIWIVAPDDFICGDIESVFNLLVEFSIEILLFNYNKVDENGCFIKKKCLVESTSEVFRGINMLEKGGKDLLSNYDLSVACRIYLRSYISSNNFRFIENAAMTDLEFSIRSLAFARRVKSIDSAIYCYRYNPNSVSNNWNFKGDKIFQLSFVIGSGILKLSEDIHELSLDYSRLLNEGAIWRINQFTISILKSPYKELLIFCRLINKTHLKKEMYHYIKWYNKILLSNSWIMIAAWMIAFHKRISR